MAGKEGSGDDEVKKAIQTLESSEYKVLTKEQYEHLMKLNIVKEKTPVNPAPVPPNPVMTTPSSISTAAIPSNPIMSTPGPIFTPSNVPRPNFPGVSPVSRLQHLLNASKGVQNATYIAPQFNISKLPFFSGSAEPQKGEVSYEVWSFEVKCLQNSNLLTEDLLKQHIRNSLKGSARGMLVPLGEGASVTAILNKLDGFYGNVSSSETLMQSFFTDYQKDNESIVDYGLRLEQVLSRAIRSGHFDDVGKDAMLRTKFWSGLKNQQLKNSTRHLFDSLKDFQSLLREIRKVEQEEISSARPAPKQKVVQQQATQSLGGSDEVGSQLLKQMNELMSRMSAMEKRLDSQQQASASADSQAPFQATAQKGGGFRNYGRGQDRRRGKGRGYQSYQSYNSGQNTYQEYGRGRGNSRDSHRGGTSGRGANTGGRGARAGSNSLNF